MSCKAIGFNMALNIDILTPLVRRIHTSSNTFWRKTVLV